VTGECRSPLGNPKERGWNAPDNPQQTVIEPGFPRTTSPSPGEEGTEEAPNKMRVRELCSRTRVFLGAIGNTKLLKNNVERSTFSSGRLVCLIERFPQSRGNLLLCKL
jgi:hypothetical protein